MQSFRDRHGKQWEIELTVGCLSRVKSSSGGKFNLWEPTSDCGGKPLCQVLDSDLSELWELLWHVLEPAANAAGITADKFGESLAAENILQARAALWREWTDFFHQLQRPDAAAMLEKIDKFHRITLEAVKKNLQSEELSQAEIKIEQAIRTRLNSNAGDLAGKLESTLETILTGNSTT